jgi:hypothetical protein
MVSAKKAGAQAGLTLKQNLSGKFSDGDKRP